MAVPQPIDLHAAIDGLTFLPNRQPVMPENTSRDWAAVVADYRDGGVFAAHYAGESQWERHTVGDEVVMVIDGETTMTMFIDGEEHAHTLGPLQMVVVPQGTWHRFSTPEEVKVLTVTPQPSEHRLAHPSEG
ncbi:MAG: cupin domain-containing protein [Actinomycetota bacterium]